MRRPIHFLSISVLIVLALSACGGGGGSSSGDSSSSGGSGSGSGSGGSDGSSSGGEAASGPTFTITEANALRLLDLAFNDAEFLQLSAELMVSGAALLQQSGFSLVDIGCSGTTGSVFFELDDADSNDALSVGDTVELVVDECFGNSVQASLSVTGLSQIGRLLDDLEGSIELALTPNGASLPALESSQTLLFNVRSGLIKWRTTSGSVSGSGIVTRGVSIDKSILTGDLTYSVSFSGLGELSGDTYEFETTEDFSGTIHSYPDQGRLLMSGDESAAEVNDESDLDARYRVDPMGTGQFGQDLPFSWPGIDVAPLFEVLDADTDDLPSGITDLNSKSWHLGGTVADAAVDVARNLVYFSIPERNEVAAVDMDSLLITERIYVGSSPIGLWLSDDGDTLYSALSYAGAVSALDLESWTLETVVVADEVGVHTVTEVVEAAPGIVFATGVGGCCPIYLARIDFNQENAVTRVADGRPLMNTSTQVLLVGPDRDYLYVQDIDSLLKLDARLANAPVILESDDSDALSTSYAISPDGEQLHSFSGAVIDTASLNVIGETDIGVPHVLASGEEVAKIANGDRIVHEGPAPDQFKFFFEFYSTDTQQFLDSYTIVCDLEERVTGLLPLSEEGEWIFFGPDGICGFDIFDPTSPPGSDSDNPSVSVERISVTSSEFTIQSSYSSDIVYDALRSRLYLTDESEQRVEAYSTDTLEFVQAFSLPNRPRSLDLGPSGSELAIVFADTEAVGFLNLDSGVTELVVPTGPREISQVHRVAYVRSEAVFAHASLTEGQTRYSELITFNRNGTGDYVTVELGPGVSVESMAYGGDRFFVLGGSLAGIIALDLSQPDFPVIAQTEVDTYFSSIAVSPFNDSVALRLGEVLRADDLLPLGRIDEGASAYSSDASVIGQLWEVSEISLFDAHTFQKTLIIETGCGSTGASEMIHMAEYNAWVVMSGREICVVPMPGSPMQSQPEMKPQPNFSPSEYCDSECVMRRHVTRRALKPSLLRELRPQD